MRDRSRTQPKSNVPWALLAVLAALVFVAYVRLRLADAPLERDEGEYAYAGRLILEGIPPYSIAYNMKFPGTYYAYAAILALFGQTPWGIHVGLMLVNAATIVLIFAVGRRLLGELAGAVAAVSYAILSVDRGIYGVSAHATHFVVLAAMAGFLLLLRAIESKRARTFFWSGALLGISVLMKQHAVVFLPLAAGLVVASERGGVKDAARVKAVRVGILAFAAVIPMALIALLLLVQGVWARFWFWTFQYAGAYVSEVKLDRAIPNFTDNFKTVTSASLVLWVVGGLGLAALWVARWEPKSRIFVTGLFVASFLAICPGLYFRPHYFILVLPAVALCCGIAVGSLRQALERVVKSGLAAALAAAVFVAAIGVYVTKETNYLFSMGTRELSRKMYTANPFVEAPEIAKYIRERTDKNDRIAVLGSEPEIYFYADRKAATGYLYTYALMEPQPFAKTMQQEMIREIESAHPKYLVFCWISTSWLAREESDQGIVEWGRKYVRQCYDAVGVVDIFAEDQTNMVWGDDVKTYRGRSGNIVHTFRRKSDDPCTVAR